MRRLSTVMAAAVASAMIVIAIAALDAVGADNSAAKPKADFMTQIGQCLRDHGVAVPALTGEQLDTWLKHHEPPLAAGRACKQALAPEASKAAGVDVTACLRAHGVTPPQAIDDLKRWILAHKDEAAVADAMKQCDMGPPPSCGDKDEQRAAPVPGAKDGRT
jgi:hypothetical protein